MRLSCIAVTLPGLKEGTSRVVPSLPLPRCAPSIHTTRNLLALGFLVQYQKYLSLRVLVLQPLVITFIMLVSTAALVSRGKRGGAVLVKGMGRP